MVWHWYMLASSWCRHNVVMVGMEKPKISEKKLKSEPPVAKINRFRYGDRTLNGGDNPIHYVK